MRTLNVQLAGILVGVTIILGGGVYFLHGWQVKRKAEFFLVQAREAKDEKDFHQAGKSYEWYVTLVPDDVDAIEEYGLLLAEVAANQRVLGRAKYWLEKLMLMDRTRNTARRKLVEVAMALGDYRGAMDHLENYLLVESPNDSLLLEQLGRCELRNGEYQKAVEQFRKAVKAAPDHLEAYPPLAMALREGLKKDAEADRVMDDIVKKNPKSAKAHFVRAAYLRVAQRTDEAMQAVQKSLELNDKDRDAITLAAYCAMEKKDYEKARNIVKRGMELYKDQPSMYVTVAEINSQAGKPAEAIEILRRGLKETRHGDEKDGEILWRLATMLVDSKQIPEAQAVLKEMRDAKTPAPLLGFWEARIEIANGHHHDACANLQKLCADLRVRSPQVFRLAQYWIGHCWRVLGNVDKEIEAYNLALEVDPGFGLARAAKAEALVRKGDTAGAIIIGGNHVNPLQRARWMVIENMKRPKEQRQWEPVVKLLDVAEKDAKDQDQALALMLRSEMMVAQDQAAQAENLVRDFCDRHPEMVEPWRILVSLAERKRDWPRAEELLNEAERKVGDKVLLYLARAQLCVRRNDKEAGKQFKGILEKGARLPADQQVQLWTGMVPYARQIGDNDLARELCRRVADKERNNVQIRYELFEIGLRAKDDAAMAAALEEIRNIAGEGAMWHYGQAVRLSTRKGVKPAELAEAAKHVETAIQLRPTGADSWLLAGGLYDQQGRLEDALAAYRKAVDFGKQNPEAIRRVVAIHFQRREYAEANAFLQRLANRVALTPELSQMRTEVLLQMKDSREQAKILAMKEAEKSTDYRRHVWLGQILSVLGQQLQAEKKSDLAATELANAEKAFRRAAELGDKSPEPWIALLQFLNRNPQETGDQKQRKIKTALDEAEKKVPADSYLAWGQMYDVAGVPDKALTNFKEAYSKAKEDPLTLRVVADYYLHIGEPLNAEPLLNTLIGLEAKGQAAEAAWGRRQLAMVLAGRGNHPDRRKATELIKKNLAAAPNSLPDLRIEARLTAEDPRRSKKVEAAEMLERLVSRNMAASPEDRFTLARLYLDLEKWPQAKQHLRSLVNSNAEPRYLTQFILAFAQHNEILEARTQLQTLQQLIPNLFPPVNLEAEILLRESERSKTPQERGQKVEEALTKLKTYVDMNNPQPAERVERIRLIAATMEQCATRLASAGQKASADRLMEQAEEHFKSYIEAYTNLSKPSPGNGDASDDHNHHLVRAAFYARQRRYQEALDLMKEHGKDANLGLLAQVMSLIIRNDVKPTLAQYQQAENILNASLVGNRDKKEGIPLLVVLADLGTAQQRYDLAEEQYRKIIALEPNSAVAYNNLAVLLALRKIKLPEALEYINKAIDIMGPHPSMLDSRASVYLAMNQAESALADINEAVADAATPVRLYHQALAQHMAGHTNEAVATLARAEAEAAKLPEKKTLRDLIELLEQPVYDKLREALR